MPLAEISAGLKVGESGVKVVAMLRRWLARRRADDAAVREAKQQLGIDEHDLYAYRAAALHPLFARGLPHPDDLAALLAVAGNEYRRGLRETSVVMVDELLVSLSEGMVLIGSPEAEGVSRLAFGYRSRQDGAGMVYTGGPVDLPFRWEKDHHHVAARCARMVPGRGRVERPNSPLVDQRGSREELLFPRLRNDGFLDTDYLLITKVPNYLTREAYESGRSLITFAGTHGTATRAVEVLLRDRRTLRQIAERLPDSATAFQVVIEAGGIKHDPEKGSRAGKVRLHDLCVLDRRPDAAWRAAHRSVQRDYDDWLIDVGAGGRAEP